MEDIKLEVYKTQKTTIQRERDKYITEEIQKRINIIHKKIHNFDTVYYFEWIYTGNCYRIK